MAEIRPIEWSEGSLKLLDQTKLPLQRVVVDVSSWRQAAEAIKTMQVRGAPAIGVTAGYAVVLAAIESNSTDKSSLMDYLEQASLEIKASRPTAVNLAWAVDRMLQVAEQIDDPKDAGSLLLNEAKRIQEEDEAINRRMGVNGSDLIPEGGSVLTHCNTGALATSAFGTALGVIRASWESGRRFKVFNTETRPFLQGARLTSWEFKQLGIPATLLVDSAAGMLIRSGEISCVITGADRIASNGDTANKIGTYSLAVLANENGIPFYIAAPTSTIDLKLEHGDQIEIEHRPQDEITHFQGVATAPEDIPAFNPSFDVTPHNYISAIITETCVCTSPYSATLTEAVQQVEQES